MSLTPRKKEIIQYKIFKVLTYNIWNNKTHWKERLQAILNFIAAATPHVVCLLDVTQDCWAVIREVKDYNSFQVFVEEGDKTGTVLLLHKQLTKLPKDSQPYYYDYEGGGRVLGVELCINGSEEPINFLATELNADNETVRGEQLNTILQVLKPLKHIVLMGDFNIKDHQEPAAVKLLTTKLQDAWIKMGCPAKLKYSYDNKERKLRSARIYYSSQFDIRSLSLTGTAKISEIGAPPSKFYGLQAVLSSPQI